MTKTVFCEHCGRSFVTTAHNAKLCTAEECQRSRSREWRRRLRAEDPAKDNERVAQWRKAARVKVILTTARSRAKKEGVPFALSEADVVVPDFCPVLGIKLSYGIGFAHDGSPSLDRIVPQRGYVPGNVRVISQRANRIKNNASLEELRALAAYVLSHTGGESG